MANLQAIKDEFTLNPASLEAEDPASHAKVLRASADYCTELADMMEI